MLPDVSKPILFKTSSPYPEIPQRGLVPSHDAVGKMLAEMGLDEGNPLGSWVKPGMRVLIKPNWVRHAATEWAELEPLVTHPSLIRPVVEFVARALQGPDGRIDGEIILADAPLQSADFNLILSQCGIRPLLHDWHRRGIPIRVADLRHCIVSVNEDTGVVQDQIPADGDPYGDTVVDLGQYSRLEELLESGSKVGVSNYDSRDTSSNHQPGIHRYRIANSLLTADVVINLPKWKTHVKTGVTGALKNFIGINCDKAYLPHFRVGSPKEGGDEYPDSVSGAFVARIRPMLERLVPSQLIRTARRKLLQNSRRSGTPMVFGGAWPGNDTLWRTVHDMVQIAKWCGAGGERRETPRTILTFMDAIVAGEGDGPLRPEARSMGYLMFGSDPGWIDAAAASLSGFDWTAIPVLSHLQDAQSKRISCFDPGQLPDPVLQLKPPMAWAKSIIRDEVHCEAA